MTRWCAGGARDDRAQDSRLRKGAYLCRLLRPMGRPARYVRGDRVGSAGSGGGVDVTLVRVGPRSRMYRKRGRLGRPGAAQLDIASAERRAGDHHTDGVPRHRGRDEGGQYRRLHQQDPGVPGRSPSHYPTGAFPIFTAYPFSAYPRMVLVHDLMHELGNADRGT